MSDNHKENVGQQAPLPGKVIFLAFLTPDNKIGIINYSKHVPSLSYISKLLDSEIIELIVEEKIKVEKESQPKIIKPDGYLSGLRSFLNRRN